MPDGDVFKALADPSRRRLLDRLNVRNGQSLTELTEGMGMARQSISQHLAILEAAHLITTLRDGRLKRHYLNAVPINEIADRWINTYDRNRVRALADLKAALEGEHMDDLRFVYTTYIRTTPERLWQALTEPAFTRLWWETSFETDWKPGSTMVWDNHGVVIEDPEQVVLEASPYHRLTYTWHSFTPELAARFGWDAELQLKLADERRSQVTFELEPEGESVRLIVTHDHFEPGSTQLEMVQHGWPAILSGLKSLLETGTSL